MARRSKTPATRSRRKPEGQSEISGLRTRIDEVDRRLHELLNERARLARKVGISKGKQGRLVDFYRPEREAQVLRMALDRNAAARKSGALRDEEVVREIVEETGGTRAGLPPCEDPRVVLDPRTGPDLEHHLDIEVGA